MHDLQKKLLSLGTVIDLSTMSYREICERVDCKHASQIQHHLGQLLKNGYLLRRPNGSLVVTDKNKGVLENSMLSVPILGEADCGEATRYAADRVQGYLTLSPSTTKIRNMKNIYALIARGDSMNRADIAGKAIEDSDYVLVEKRDPYVPSNGDCVVSIMNGMANIKTYQHDDAHSRVILRPASFNTSHSPIIIADEDFQYYQIAGRVVDVIKSIDHLDNER